MSRALSIAVFSDVVCPWCFIGKRRFERALRESGFDDTATVEWLPFELNPDMPADGMERSAYRARKFGAERSAAMDAQIAALGEEEGIRFAFDRIGRTPNTRRAHMLIAHASRSGEAGAAVEALFRAYFEEGRDIGRGDVLIDVAAAAGLDRDAAAAALKDEQLDRFVTGIAAQAAQLGIAGVPFFVIDRAFSVSGAQPTEAWVDALRQIASGELQPSPSA